jgi:hypothetical protein
MTLHCTMRAANISLTQARLYVVGAARGTGRRGEAEAARTRLEIFGVLAARFGLIAGAINDLDGANDAGIGGFE